MIKTSLNKILSSEFIKEEINDLYNNGMPTGYTLGIDNIDNLFRLDLAMVSIITGVPNYGKSEFLDFVCVQLNKRYNLKTLYFSPENFPIKRHLAKLLSKLTNRSFNGLSKEEIDTNMNYIVDNFYFLNYETVNTLDEILVEAERLIIERDIKIINIDPYNTLEDQRPNNLTETEYVSQVMTRLQKFAKKYNVLINLVVHPKKLGTDSDGYTLIPNRYDLNGSANFANKSDYIIIVHRDFERDITIIKCDKCKFNNYGKIGEIEIKYDPISTNYLNIDNTKTTNEREEDKYMTTLKITNQVTQENKNRNVLNVNVSYFHSNREKKGIIINLYEYLMDKNKEYYNKYGKMIQNIRMCTNDEERKKIKNNLPCIMVSCVTGDNKANIMETNNLICIDIDKKDNPIVIDTVPQLIKQLACVAYLSKSVSGTGYYCIIPIKNKMLFRQHFNALEQDFRNMGIVIDTACKNVNRLRYYSFDESAYINTNAEIYTSLIEDPIKNYTNIDNNKIKPIKISDKSIKDMLDYIDTNKLDITNTYKQWLSIGAAIANTYREDGRDLYHSICRYHKDYNSNECDNKYDELLINSLDNIHINTLFYIYNKCKKEYEINNEIH